MKYRSKKGTTINIPDGLSPKQIKAIQADADAGYGTRAQQTANQLGKKLKNQPVAPEADPTTGEPVTDPGMTQPEVPLTGGGLSQRQQARLDYLLKNRPNDPQVATLRALQAKGGDGGASDDLFPDDTTKDGTGSTTADPDDIFDKLMETPNFDDLQGNISSARQGMYKSLTRDFETNKRNDMEAAKQEMANRGIPFSPDTVYDANTTDLYGRTIGGIDRGYKDREMQAWVEADKYANDQGTTMYNSAVAAVGQSNRERIDTLLALNDQQLGEMGLNREFLLKKREQKQRDRELDIADKVANKAGSGGGGGGGFDAGGGQYEFA